MNSSIEQRTNIKLQQNQNITQHEWKFNGDKYQRTYIVLPKVFSPAIFLGTEWLTHQILSRVSSEDKFLEIGCGIGVTSIQVALCKANQNVVCSDINQNAVKCTKINSKNHEAEIKVLLSDVYENIPDQKFDIIYWNFPFHPSTKAYSSLTLLQKSVRDPNYEKLNKFIGDSKKYLNQKGRIYLGFSLVMGDFRSLQAIAKKFAYKIDVVEKMEKDGQAWICLIQLVQEYQ